MFILLPFRIISLLNDRIEGMQCWKKALRCKKDQLKMLINFVE